MDDSDNELLAEVELLEDLVNVSDEELLDEVEAMEQQQDDEAERMESDEELLAEVEQMETQVGGALADERGHFRFDLVPFRQRQARSYGVQRTSYHLRVRNPIDTRPTGHRNIVRAFEQGLADALDSLIRDLPDHDRIQVYLGSNRLRSAHTSAHVFFASPSRRLATWPTEANGCPLRKSPSNLFTAGALNTTNRMPP